MFKYKTHSRSLRFEMLPLVKTLSMLSSRVAAMMMIHDKYVVDINDFFWGKTVLKIKLYQSWSTDIIQNLL